MIIPIDRKFHEEHFWCLHFSLYNGYMLRYLPKIGKKSLSRGVTPLWRRKHQSNRCGLLVCSLGCCSKQLHEKKTAPFMYRRISNLPGLMGVEVGAASAKNLKVQLATWRPKNTASQQRRSSFGATRTLLLQNSNATLAQLWSLSHLSSCSCLCCFAVLFQ